MPELCYHVMFSGRPLMLRDLPPTSRRHVKDKTKPLRFKSHRTSDTCNPVSCWCSMIFTISMCFSAQLNLHQSLVKEDLGALVLLKLLLTTCDAVLSLNPDSTYWPRLWLFTCLRLPLACFQPPPLCSKNEDWASPVNDPALRL